jgi:hypothetical protein
MISKNLDEVRQRLASELKRVGPELAAEQAGVSLATVYNWMKGANTPLNKLMQLESAGVDALFVLTGQPSQPQAASTVSEGDRVLLSNFHAAPEQVQAGVKTTLEAFEPAAAAGKRKPKAA